MRRIALICFCLASLISVEGCRRARDDVLDPPQTTQQAQPAPSVKPSPSIASVDYLRQIKPILRQACYRCHGALARKARLRLDTRTAIFKGGRGGPAIVPGKPEESLLLERVQAEEGERMPPDGAPLSADQVSLLERWVREGATGPADEKPEEDARQHWAFRPVRRPAVPQPANRAWPDNPIDAFLAAQHDRRGLKPAPPAPPEVLLRRLSLDLTGLPPTPDQVRAFLADPSPAGWRRQVDRLLASPSYGERWARHWMDVWRYSDWYGRRAVPDVWNSAPQVWRWRDWIVASLNGDKGYDGMVSEMLAADEIAPGDEQAVVATGFLVRNWYALNHNQWMRDNVEHTAKAFLGLTFHCAHCHDHKYDPITQADYFRFRAFFEPLGLRQDWIEGEDDPGPFQNYAYGEIRKVVKLGRVTAFDERPDAKTYPYRGGDERDRFKDRPPAMPGVPTFLGGNRLKIEPVHLSPEVTHPGLRPFVQRAELEARQRELAQASEVNRRVLAEVLAPVAANRHHTPARLDEATARYRAALAEVIAVAARIAADNARYRFGQDSEALAHTASRAEREAHLARAEHRLAQLRLAAVGPKQPGQPPEGDGKPALARASLEAEMARKALVADSACYKSLGPVYPAVSTGRRKALALWITSADNPLTARVAVNHVWNWHFGRPLVDTVADFGRNGHKPANPELLDWLASELMRSGWSLKHLHRLILTSNAYRMHSAVGHNETSHRADPDNRLLWRFPHRRAEAEVVRDSLLYVAGELDQQMGGPPTENTVADTTFRRRSLYFSIYPEEGGTPSFLGLFDAPNPCDCYRRDRCVVPQQALALTNSELVHDLAGRLAERLAGLDNAQVIEQAFLRVLACRPTSRERDVCVRFLAGRTGETRRRAIAGLVRGLFNHEGFLSIR
jgi:hypothetical protein